MRKYSEKTIKQLFGLCGNQCAYPGCANEIIVGETEHSDEEVVGHICHIYAAADNGPRGKPDLTEEEKNSFANLILLCGHHHPIVDKQWQTYPADVLIGWKKEHEAQAKKGTAKAIKRDTDIQKHAFIEQLSDSKIEEAVNRVRQGRDIFGFPTTDEALMLAAQVEQSILSGGSNEVRARALAWCSRMLSQGDTIEKAKEFLAKSKQLAITSEAKLAQAFITAITDKVAALTELAKLNSAAARAAALRIVTNADGPGGAIAWAKSAGLTVDSFDPEGKNTLTIDALLAGDWDTAIATAAKLNESDFAECPTLLHTTALAKLITVIPLDLRASAVAQVPFVAETFPLASEPHDLLARREARSLFERFSAFAQLMGMVQASNLASDYALWLGLRDPIEHASAFVTLRDSMRDPAQSLRRLNLALQFGIKLDLKAIEARIDQSVALSGKGTGDEALARFSLAFAQGSYKDAADYIDKHRAQFYEHFPKALIQGIEIETLARAGLISSATEKLDAAVNEGLPNREQEALRHIIAEASGADPIAERRALYEATLDLPALANLVDALEQAGLWQDLLPYAEKLLEKTRSVEECERVAHCLDVLSRYGDLLDFMSRNTELVDQSENLKVLWAWTLYREGRFDEARQALKKLPADSRNPNVKLLRVNMAVASGAWDELIEFTNEVWANRDKCSAADLLYAAQLSIAVNGPHSRELVIAATEKEPDRAEILAGAYFQAANAGWEQNQAVAEWIGRAAQLSGDNGPLKSISLNELIEQKPEWDKQALSLSDQLRAGKIPAFAAAQLLNRSLLEFYLLPSLSNPTEIDVRKRRAIFAYSGARPPQAIAGFKKIALDSAAIITLAHLELLETVIARFEVIIPHSTLGWLFQEKQKATFHQPSRIKDAGLLKQLLANGTLSVLSSEEARDDKLVREVGPDLAALLASAKSASTAETKTLVIRSAPLYRVGSVMQEEADISGYTDNISSCIAVIDRLKAKGALTMAEEQKARAFLKLHEKPWPNEQSIDDKTEVYLDSVAISHLRAAGVLGKLKAAGIKAHIADEEDKEANALLAIQSLGGQQLEVIERIRSALANGIASNRIRAMRTMKTDDDEQLFRLHPTYGVLSLAEHAEAIVVDDRFINQHLTVTAEGRTTPLLSSLDILDHLRAVGDLTTDQLFAQRTALRQAGYQLIPVSDEELKYHLNNAQVANGRPIETAELKAIRESLLLAKMRNLMQIPTEALFLYQSLGAFIRAIKEKWLTASQDDAKAFGEYLLRQVDVRLWTPSAIPGNERAFATCAYAVYAMQIISPPPTADEATQTAYHEWITDIFLNPIKEYQPEVFSFIVARLREMAIGAAEQAAAKLEKP